MKNKIVATITVLALMGFIGLFCYIIYDNVRLQRINLEQNHFIKEVTGKDSVFFDNSKKYQDSLKKYTEKLSWYIGDRQVSSDQFIDAYRNLEKERDSIKRIFDFAKTTYGFKIKSVRTGSYTETSAVPYTRADSSKVALEVFRKRIKIDKDGWVVDVAGSENNQKFSIDMGTDKRGSKNSIDSVTKPKQRSEKDSIKK